MEYKILPIQALTDGQITEISELHLKVIPSLLTELGLPFVERYYRIAHRDDTAIGFCSLSETGTSLGWVVGSSKPGQVNDQMREPLSWFIPHLFRALVKHPRLIRQLLISSRSASLDVKPDCIELVYLGVSPSARKLGLGMELIRVFKQASAEKFRSISLSVEVENTAAIRLYTKTGFVITDTLAEGTFKRHRMDLKI